MFECSLCGFHGNGRDRYQLTTASIPILHENDKIVCEDLLLCRDCYPSVLDVMIKDLSPSQGRHLVETVKKFREANPPAAKKAVIKNANGDVLAHIADGLVVSLS